MYQLLYQYTMQCMEVQQVNEVCVVRSLGTTHHIIFVSEDRCTFMYFAANFAPSQTLSNL